MEIRRVKFYLNGALSQLVILEQRICFILKSVQTQVTHVKAERKSTPSKLNNSTAMAPHCPISCSLGNAEKPSIIRTEYLTAQCLLTLGSPYRFQLQSQCNIP
jgi:hypothetical protein